MRFPATGMTVRSVRVWLVTLIAAVGVAVVGFVVLAPVAQAAAPPEFGVEKFVAANCSASHEECGSETIPVVPHAVEYSVPKEPSLSEAKEQGYTQAAGHPAWGITDFKVNTVGTLPNEVPVGVTEGEVVSHVRTDVGPGVSTNPEAVPQCTMAQFGEKEAIPGTGFYEGPGCPESGSESTVIGVNKAVVWVGPKPFPEGGDLPIEGTVYNLVQPQGLAADFGVALKLPIALTKHVLEEGFEKAGHPYEKSAPGLEKKYEEGQYYSHGFIEGGVEWAGNYHDYYETKVSTALPLISSRLILKGNIGTRGLGGFITNPSNCAGPGPATTSTVTLNEAASTTRSYTGPIGAEGCHGESPFLPVPFEPGFALSTATTQSDQPTGVTTTLTVPHAPGAGEKEIDSSQLDAAIVALPEGMTLNPSAAAGLEACKPAQIGLGTRNPATCPYGSKIGTVTIDTPDLPPGSLKGNIYLGGSESGQITSQPYTIYLNAESERYGVTVRVPGTVEANETTGRVVAKFEKLPEQPASEVVLHFKNGPLAPIANPLACGAATTETRLTPYIGAFATKTPSTSFVVDSNGAGGACPAKIPFAPTQSSVTQPATAGASTNFAFTVTRPPGQQYLTQIKTVLPAGLVGRIPDVSLCSEALVAEAAAGTGGCPASSRIGTVVAYAGAGSSPYRFEGSAYLTGPYGGAPYGLALVVPANAGPFHLGNVVTHETISVDPYTTRVTVAGSIPTIYKGIPLRLQSITVEANRQGFMLNPTSCVPLFTESVLTGMAQLGSSTFTTAQATSPLVTEGCKSLSFRPNLTAIAGAKTSRLNGAGVEVNVTQPAGQTNIQQVTTTLPPQLPVRLSTLSKACPAATFEAGPAPGGCKSEAKVGTAKAVTPVLPGTLTGTAWLVSHGNEAYPNLDVILSGDGVTVILVGKSKVANSQITTTFNTLPDVPVSSFSLYLPTGSNSVLGANGKLCRTKMRLPTTFVGQNVSLLLLMPTITMRNCPVEIVKHSTRGATATLHVQIPAAGTVSGGGTNLKFTKRKIGASGRNTVKVSLTRIGKEVLRRFRVLRVKVRVGFVPKTKKNNITSRAFATVTFRA